MSEADHEHQASSSSFLTTIGTRRFRPQRVYGIHQEFPIALAPYLSLDEQLVLFKNTGATAVRQRMRWDEIETAQGQFNWAQMDDVIDGFLGAGIDPLLTLRDTPAWAADPACTAEEVTTCPPNLDAWGSFVSSAADRYKGKVVYWEIWNEPNTVKMWAGTAQDYYLLLQRASTEIRDSDPAAQIVIGGMTHGSVLNQGDWLRSLLGAPDIQQLFDVFSFHLYRSVGQPEETFDSLNDLLAEFDLSEKEVWVTETNPQMGSEQEQAQALAGWFERIFLQGATRAYYFTFPNWCGDDLTWEKEWFDANVYGLDKPTGGLVHNVDFTPTLVYESYQDMTGERVFFARLAGDEVVPPVVADSTAFDSFHLNHDETLLQHLLFATDIKFAAAAHIRCAESGADGPIGVTLYSGRPRSMEAGVLAVGRIPGPDPGNACGWADLDDVVDAMRAGAAYVSIRTLAHPAGEVRGQIR